MDIHEKLMGLAVPTLAVPPSLAAARAGLEKLALTATELTREAAKVEPNPTEAQKESGNYKKGHVTWKGLGLTIETAKGQYRRGKGKDGKPWQTLIKDHYGYIKRTESEADGDHIDIFLSSDQDLRSELVFIVNQLDPATGKFDEHKCILGCVDEESAKAAYLRNYEPGWKGLGSIRSMTLADFKKWIKSGDTSKAADDLSDLKEALSLENSVTEARKASEPAKKEKKEEPSYEALTGQNIKLGMSLHLSGDVQGVHLRATLHKLLDQYKAPGLAYNDARTGDVYASLPGDDETNVKVLQGLRDYFDKSTKVNRYNVEESRKKDKLKKVDLDDTALENMFKRQGFQNHSVFAAAGMTPEAYRRQYVTKRYRLTEDPMSHHMLGEVPALAYKQLMGQEPIYGHQLTNPEKYDNVSWTKQKIAGDRIMPPCILLVKRATDEEGPFTVAVDLDGTLAENYEVFDATKIGAPRPEVLRWVRAFHDAGARIIIWTVRGDKKLVRAWLEEHDVPFDYINENPDQPEGSSGKIIADVYWDDRGYNALDADDHGPEILEQIREETEEEEAEEPKKGPSVLIHKTEYRVLLAPDDILEEIMEAV